MIHGLIPMDHVYQYMIHGLIPMDHVYQYMIHGLIPMDHVYQYMIHGLIPMACVPWNPWWNWSPSWSNEMIYWLHAGLGQQSNARSLTQSPAVLRRVKEILIDNPSLRWWGDHSWGHGLFIEGLAGTVKPICILTHLTRCALNSTLAGKDTPKRAQLLLFGQYSQRIVILGQGLDRWSILDPDSHTEQIFYYF